MLVGQDLGVGQAGVVVDHRVHVVVADAGALLGTGGPHLSPVGLPAANGWVESGYSAARIRVAASYVSSMLTMAVDDGILDKPVKGARLPALPSNRIEPLT